MSRSYEEMVELVRGWSNRDREALPDMIIQDCLRWAADKAYRTLRVPPLEQTVTYPMEQLIAATSSTNNRYASVTELAIPEDLIEFIQIRGVDADGRTTRMFNEKADIRTFNDLYAEKYNDFAYWSRQGDCILLSPGFGNAGTNFGSTGVLAETGVELYYYRRLPALNARYLGNFENANAIVGADTEEIFNLNGDLTEANSTYIDSILSEDPMNPDYSEVEAIRADLMTRTTYPAIPGFDRPVELNYQRAEGTNTLTLALPGTVTDPRETPLGSNQSPVDQPYGMTEFLRDFPDTVIQEGDSPVQPMIDATEGESITLQIGSQRDTATGVISGDLAVGQPVYIAFTAVVPLPDAASWAQYGLANNNIRPEDNAPGGPITLYNRFGNSMVISPETPFMGTNMRFTGPHPDGTLPTNGYITNTRFTLGSVVEGQTPARDTTIPDQTALNNIRAFANQLHTFLGTTPTGGIGQLVNHTATERYNFGGREFTAHLDTTIHATLENNTYTIDITAGPTASELAGEIRSALQAQVTTVNPMVTFPDIPSTEVAIPLLTTYGFYAPGTDVLDSTRTESRWVRGRFTPHWLREQNERVLLMGALAEAFFYLQEDDQAQKYAQLFAAEIAELNNEDVMRNASGGNVQMNFNGRGLI